MSVRVFPVSSLHEDADGPQPGVPLRFKMASKDSRLVRATLVHNGFRETESDDYNLFWTSTHVKPQMLRALKDFQRVNHFPRSNEVTRKDRLYSNILRMQQKHSARQFEIVPKTFLLPAEFNQFYAHWTRERGLWIAKPIASSQGRGIHLVEHPSDVALDQPTVLCHYIANPLLIDGFKVFPPAVCE
jgi:tubulin polyglutamylase TTLL5